MAAHAGQVIHLRKTPAPVEAEPAPEPEPAPQEAAPAVLIEPETVPEAIALPGPFYEPIRLLWRGAGNVVSAAGCAVFALVGGA